MDYVEKALAGTVPGSTPEGIAPGDWQAYREASAAMWAKIDAGRIEVRRLDRLKLDRAFDVPPWLTGTTPRPRFARLRWAFRRVWPGGVWR